MKARLYSISEIGFYKYRIIALNKKDATDFMLAKQCIVNGERDSSGLTEAIDLTDDFMFNYKLLNNKKSCELVEKGINKAIIVDQIQLFQETFGYWHHE